MEPGEIPDESVTVMLLREDKSDTWENAVFLPEPGDTWISGAFNALALRVLFWGAFYFGKRSEGMVHFVGAGPGAPDLITVRGANLLREADLVIYAGSLVNPALLENCREECEIYNSAKMTLEEVLSVISDANQVGKRIVRLHTGDPSVYGAIREQMEALERLSVEYDITPGVSSFCAAAAAARAEYTLPGINQTVILTRIEGKTPVPEREKLALLAAHGASMAIFLSSGMLRDVQEELLKGTYAPDTPAAIVYKATWPEEKVLRCTVGTLSKTGEQNHIQKTALVMVGDFLSGAFQRSKLYDPEYSTEFRQGREREV